MEMIDMALLSYAGVYEERSNVSMELWTRRWFAQGDHSKGTDDQPSDGFAMKQAVFKKPGPMYKGRCASVADDYWRNGEKCLFAVLNRSPGDYP
jgi:hypothetical protein